MAKVETNFKTVQHLVPMGSIPQGKIGVIVESPINSYRGTVVIGGSNGKTYGLNNGEVWDRISTGNKVRLLEPGETVTLSNE